MTRRRATPVCIVASSVPANLADTAQKRCPIGGAKRRSREERSALLIEVRGRIYNVIQISAKHRL